MREAFKAVIVEDERIARNNLLTLLAEHPEIKVVGEADSVNKAIEVIEKSSPDVVFLDIQLRGESGFELLNRLKPGEVSFKVIFVTAYDQYAIRAFEVNALDYLLKPIEPRRLAEAINRLFKSEIASKTTKAIKGTKGTKWTKKLDYYDPLLLEVSQNYRFIEVATIACLQAAGGYSELWTSDGKRGLVFMSLQQWEERLPERYFIRIHRSTIINLEYVERIERVERIEGGFNFNYSYKVYLKGVSEPLIMSRRQAAKLKGKLK